MKDIRILCMDVDGTLTDGKIYISDSGELFKAFNVKDGYAIRNLLSLNNIIPVIITGRKSGIVSKRCEELAIGDVYQGVSDKLQLLNRLLKEKNITYSNVAYIGDDTNDFECMNIIKNNGGVVGCPNDAVKQIVEISHYVSEKKGGEGAVRDFIEWIMRRQ